MEIFRGAFGKRGFNPEPETDFCAGEKGITITASQFDGGGWIAGVAHWYHCAAKIPPLCQRLRRRSPHFHFLDAVAGHTPGNRQYGRGRGTPARRDGGTVVPAGFTPASVC